MHLHMQNPDPFPSLEVVLHAINFSIYICRCARQVLSPIAIGGGNDQVLAVTSTKCWHRWQLVVTLAKCRHQLHEKMAVGGEISQVLAAASAKGWQWHQPSVGGGIGQVLSLNRNLYHVLSPVTACNGRVSQMLAVASAKCGQWHRSSVVTQSKHVICVVTGDSMQWPNPPNVVTGCTGWQSVVPSTKCWQWQRPSVVTDGSWWWH